MDELELNKLLKRFKEGTCSEEEKEMLELWFDHQSNAASWNWESEEEKEQLRLQMLEGIGRAVDREQPRWVRMNYWYRGIAASFLVMLMIGGYLYKRSTSDLPDQNDYRQAVVAPGTSQAMLTLSDGTSVLVDDAARGIVSSDGNMQVIKTDEGELAYREKEGAKESAGRNTLYVPRGGTFQVTLPDGSRVWLNSSTSMTFPAGNRGAERLVELKGEAYFEVRTDKKRPFRVMANGTEVRVTGTRFNVSAYEEDKHLATTLAEGQVIVTHLNQEKILKPGQQATISSSGTMQVAVADVESALAWKDGYFVFEDQDLTSIMKMVARWYDVEVEYKGTPPPQRFGGTFSKSKGLDGLLTYLEQLSTIHFTRQGKKIIVH